LSLPQFKDVEPAQVEDFAVPQLYLIIAGIVLDLIRIKSDNTISAQFLKELADMVKPKQL